MEIPAEKQAAADVAAVAARPPGLADIIGVWARLGALGFGGPAGQIAMMHRTIVDERRWLDEPRFLHALNFCMLLPGPEALQLAIYTGWLTRGLAGALIAGVLFILPGALVMMALSIVFVVFGQVGIVAGVLLGIKAAVLAIVVEAMLRIGRRGLKTRTLVGVAAAAFVAIFFLQVPFPVVVLAAAAAGAVLARFKPEAVGITGASAETAQAAANTSPRRLAATLTTAGAGLAAWFLPVAVVVAVFGESSTFAEICFFFSRMAVVTFGGAYAVLAYVAQAAVEGHGWLSAKEMLIGLGLAETTPGPLVLVLQFVGFLAGFRDAGPLSPLAGGVLGGLLASWVTFVPSFVFILVGAPYVERLRRFPALSAALAAITAAVVGVILNLTVWFAVHVLFSQVDERFVGPVRLLVPVLASIDWVAAAIAGVACIALFVLHQGMLRTLAIAAALGAIAQAVA